MVYSKYTPVFILALQILLPLGIFADKVPLDLHADQNGKWPEISCLYNEDYKDFWVYGYPVDLSGDDDVFPNQKGFWTAGLNQRCEMHYYGGYNMPKAKSLTVGMYVKGTPELLITSKDNILDDEYIYEIGSIPNDADQVGWFETTIDLTDKDQGYVFNFTILTQGDDILLLDKIEFDLGEDTTTPAPPTEPTTKLPIVDDLLTLDTEENYWIVWEQDCHYVDDTAYMWAFGCPQTDLKEDDLKNGYWNPCSASRACNLTFHGNSTVMSGMEPESIKIRTYVGGGGLINVTVQSNLNSPTCDRGCSVLGVLEGTDDKWTEFTVPVNTVYTPEAGYKINIQLVPEEGSTVLVEKVEILLQEIKVTTPTTTTTTESTGSTSGSTGSTPTESSTTPGGSGSSAPGIMESNWVLAFSILLSSISFFLKL